ncbi:MAG TPA: molybdopterin-dependent oxidoreductase [Clostridia bacterium]|nr:molybdopterin-dependent oxidoreductase [Clostridia bacterium]
MNKNTKTLIIIILILVGISSTGLYLNKDNIKRNKELNEKAIFEIYDSGEFLTAYTMKEIREMGEEKFEATLDTSSTQAKAYEYTGVLLKKIFKAADLEIHNRELVAVTGADGYTVALSINKVIENDNVYLAYKREGISLGTREDGGNGPYQLIIRKDQFSQNWCKYVVKADVR